MIKTTLMLRSELANYANTDAKIKRMVNAGLLFPIVRGLYETDKTVQGHYLAQSIYGPSYLSFEFALSYHGLIPEAVYNYTCATFESNRQKKFDNSFGVYIYNSVPSKAYPWDILLKTEGEYSYQIATAEKAICDMLYKTSPLKNLNGLREYLFEDLRISPDDFYGLNLKLMAELSLFYSTQNHRLLKSLLGKEKTYG